MVQLDGRGLTLETVRRIVEQGEAVEASPSAMSLVDAAAQFIERLVASEQRIYGVNTGFGKLSTVPIERAELGQLQLNLLRSHACAVGEPLPDEVSRAALLFRVNALLKGHSGVRSVLIDRLIEWLNRGVCPVIPSQGSMGSSGDLAPLAHLALPLVGEGAARWNGQRYSGNALLEALGERPLALAPKEGLALINGTQVSLAVGVLAYLRAGRLMESLVNVTALAFEAAGARTSALDPALHGALPHPGQMRVAEWLRTLLEGSRLVDRSADIQDPYSLRCAPQILGACWDGLGRVETVLEIEMNGATDNPLLFPAEGKVLSGGNFHGEALAQGLDQLSLAVAEAGNLAERQTAYLLELPDLPPFLTGHSGLHSGLMIPQYTAASLASENRILAHPASVGSIPTSAGKEDHNSLASIAARKTAQIVANSEYIGAILTLTACQALEFRERDAMSHTTGRLLDRVRQRVPSVDVDRVLADDLERLRDLIRSGGLLDG